MKSFIYYLFILILIACKKEVPPPLEPILQNVTVTPIKTGSTEIFTDITFSAGKVGYICGTYGTILKTVDGGMSWISIKSDIKPSLNCILALDNRNVFTARNDLYHSQDGGATWETLGMGTDDGIFDINFPSASTGYLMKLVILKSTDSGKTWTVIYNPMNEDIIPDLHYDQLQFLSESIGFCAGGKTNNGNSFGNIHKTIDGGKNWINLKMKMSDITAFHFMDANTGYVFNYKKELWKTLDGGISWELVSNQIPDEYPDCHFVSSLKIILRTQIGIYHSVDGGVKWHKDFEVNPGTNLIKMKFVDQRTGFVVGRNGFLAKIELE